LFILGVCSSLSCISIYQNVDKLEPTVILSVSMGNVFLGDAKSISKFGTSV